MADTSRPVTGYPAPDTNPNGVYPPPSTNPNTTPNPTSTPTTGYPPPTSTTNGVAYPYAAGPPPHQPSYYQQPYYQPPQPQHYPQQPYNPGNYYLRRVFSILIIIFIIFGTFVFITWLIFRPRIPEFRVDNFTVKNFNLTGNSLSASWDLNITSYNPNTKMDLVYDNTLAVVYYDRVSLADNTLPPFQQKKKSQTPLLATFTVANRYLPNSIVEGIKKDRDKNGNVEFDVRMAAYMEFEAGIWRHRRRSLRVYCADLLVSLSNNTVNGALIKGPKNCRVGF